MRVTRHHSCWVSPFGNPRINARLTAPRGISQPPTSFIGSRCQGIHHAPLSTYLHTKTKEKNYTFNENATVAGRALNRCSQPLSNTQTPHPTTKMEGLHSNEPSVVSGPNSVSGNHLLLCTRPSPTTGENPSRLTPHHQDGGTPLGTYARLLSQGPIVCLAIACCCAPSPRPLQTRTPHGSHSTNWSVSRGAP